MGVAAGLVVTGELAAFSLPQLRVVVSGLVALVLTTAGMLALHSVHPPACATTLIASPGLLPTVFDGLLIVTR